MLSYCICIVVFFFKQKTAYEMRISDWSSDVCSSDLDASEVVTVVKNGQPLASVLSFFFRDEVLPYYGGGCRAARVHAANDFMYWAVMRRACESGRRVFDFGRSKVGTGSYALDRKSTRLNSSH